MKKILLGTSLFLIFNILILGDALGDSWQNTLESYFDITETFDRYDDWVGNSNNRSCAGNDSGFNSEIFDSHCYYERRAPVESRPKVIDNWGSSRIVSGKGMRINWPGNGTGNQESSTHKVYFGDGTWDSGYREIYIFFSMNMPSDRLWTRTSSSKGDDGRYIADVVQGDDILYFNSGKWVAASIGFTSAGTWGPNDISTSKCRWGWSEVHFHIKTTGNPKTPRVVLDSGGIYFRGQKGNVDITSFLDRKIWVELYLKRDSSIGTPDGAAKCTFYDQDGNGTVVLDVNNISLLDPDGSCEESSGVSKSQADRMKFNRINIESNWRVHDGGDRYVCCGKLYDPSMNIIRNLSCEWYLDDFIIDNNTVASKYFSLLKGTNPKPEPTSPTHLRTIN